MLPKLWHLLTPFHKDYFRYVAAVLVRQMLLVFGGFLMVWALRAAGADRSIPEWAFVAAFIAFDAGFLRFDIGVNSHFASRLGYPLFGKLRVAALTKVFDMPLEWHQNQDAGSLVGKVNTGVGKVVQTAEGLSRELLPAVIRTVFSLVPLLIFCPKTTPPVLFALAGFLYLTGVENRKRQPHRKLRNEGYYSDFSKFAECVQYVQPMVQFGQTGRMLHEYDRIQKNIMEQGLEEVRISNVFSWPRNMLLSVTKRMCQGIWLWQYRAGALDAAMVMYLNMLTEELLNSFWSYASLIERLFDGIEPTRVFVELLDQPSVIRDEEAATVPLEGAVGFEMLNIHFAYSNGRKLMSDFNLRVEPGAIVGIVGRSGIGKTTIHNLLSRMFDVQQGSILVGGSDIRKWPLKQLRGLFSYVSQQNGVFLSGSTVLDTIRFARPEATLEEAVTAAKTACIHEDILRMPDKYLTRIGQGGTTLSRGQQQRVALAQAIIALTDDRKVLVLDEFTSALDAHTEEEVLRNLLPHLKGRTVLIIAHRLATLRRAADRIVVMGESGVIEEGSHAELMERGGVYADLAKRQMVA